MALVGFNILGAIGLDLTLKCVTAVTTSAQGIYSLVTSISSNKQEPSIGKLLEELDIGADIRTLESLLKEFNVKKHHTETLAICLELLQKCVEEIEIQLNEVQLRLSYNKSLWVSVRAYTFTDVIDKMRLLKHTLDNRKNNLFEVIKINGYLNVDPKRLELVKIAQLMDAEII
jgi:hypothetical protein